MKKISIALLATIFLSPWSITATKIHDACKEGNLQEVEKLIASRAEVNTIDSNGWTPLHIAVSAGYEGITKLLLGIGADIGAKNKYGSAPLHWAACNGHEKVVKQLTAAPLLLKQSKSINSKLSKETLNKLDDYCVGYSREVFNQPIPNKDFKFFQELPELAMKSVIDNILPIKNYIESRYIKAFLKLCHQDLKDNPEQSAFANLFIHEIYKKHLLELKLYIAIRNNDKQTAIDWARTFNKKNIVMYLEAIEKTQKYGELDKDLRIQTESNYQLAAGYVEVEPVEIGSNVL